MRRLVTAIVAGSLLLTVGCQVGPRVDFVEHDDKIEVVTSGQEFTEYLFGGRAYTLLEGANKGDHGFLAKPAFLPVRSPSGIVVTRGYPLLAVEGEKPEAVAVAARDTPEQAQAREELALNPPRSPHDIFPIPIREDLVVYLQNIPLDMSQAEARKIATVIQALALPEEDL